MAQKKFLGKLLAAFLCAAISLSTAAAFGQAPKAEAATTSKASRVIGIGDNYLGVRYKFGAPSGVSYVFDCSSFTQYVFRKVGIRLPRSSRQQSHSGYYVSRKNLKKGDLIFFSTSGSHGRVGHVAIYAGNNRMLHTYGAGGVKFSRINAYWSKHYITARRVI